MRATVSDDSWDIPAINIWTHLVVTLVVTVTLHLTQSIGKMWVKQQVTVRWVADGMQHVRFVPPTVVLVVVVKCHLQVGDAGTVVTVAVMIAKRPTTLPKVLVKITREKTNTFAIGVAPTLTLSSIGQVVVHIVKIWSISLQTYCIWLIK